MTSSPDPPANDPADSPVNDPAIAAVVEDLRELIRPGQVVAIGEWHGTVEWPALVSALVDASLAAGLTTVVGLEVPMSHDLAEGSAGPFFERAVEFQDGRSSQAMAGLVDRLAELTRGGADLHAVAMDGPWVAPGSPVPLHLIDHLERPRDETMAANLMAVLDRVPRAFTVVLAGNEHTRVTRRPDSSPTLGSILSAWYPRTVALLTRARGGQAWVLLPDGTAGPTDVPDDSDLDPGASWSREAGADGHHGFVQLGLLTPSAPAHAGPSPA